MPVHHQKKDTTPNIPGSTQEQPAPLLPDQQAFQQMMNLFLEHVSSTYAKYFVVMQVGLLGPPTKFTTLRI